MEVVAEFCLSRVDSPRRCEPRGAIDEVNLPLAVVDQGVVGSTEESGVVEIGFSAFLPRNNVVGFAPGGDGGAAWKGASEVSGEDEFALGRCEKALGAASVDDFLTLAVCQGGDFWIAQGLAEQG